MLHPNQEIKIKADTPKPQETKTAEVTTPRPVTTSGTGGYTTSFSSDFTDKVVGKVKNFFGSMGNMFGGLETAVLQLAQLKKQEADARPKSNYSGTAIYLNYPNFEGSAKNALKIGNFDVGEASGIQSLPVGHAAAILIGDDGNAYHYEYGRYGGNSAGVIGKERRASVKGGNFKRTALARKRPDETAEQYIQRIYSSLPNAKYGTLQATIIPEVDTKAANDYWQRQADDPNRQEYNIAHTCAGEACNLVSDFVSPGTRFLNFFEDLNGPSLIDAVNKPEGVSWASHLWGLIPGTTGSKNRDIQERSGTTTLILGNK